MPSKKVTDDQLYKRLLRDLRREVEQARANIQQHLVLMYWTIGKGMAAYLNTPGVADHLASLCRRLSQDLSVHIRTLQQCHQFFSVYSDLDRSLPISWSHYRCLLSLPSAKERRYWQLRIIQEKLSQKQLLALLKEQKVNGAPVAGATLGEPERGLLYHYRLIHVDYLAEHNDQIMIDCGFENRVVPPETDWTLVNKRIVRCEKQDGAYQIKVTQATTADIYTFKALVERFIDGDTLVTNVDCGFGIWSRQRLRFKGIDAPELDTVDGQRTKIYVESRLGLCEFVIIKTYKSDKYDRYLVDVFYLPGEKDPAVVARQGIYLNQELIDRGLAQPYMPDA